MARLTCVACHTGMTREPCDARMTRIARRARAPRDACMTRGAREARHTGPSRVTRGPGMARHARVTRPSCIAGDARVARVARGTGISRHTGMTGPPGIAGHARMSRMTRPARRARVACWSRITGDACMTCVARGARMSRVTGPARGAGRAGRARAAGRTTGPRVARRARGPVRAEIRGASVDQVRGLGARIEVVESRRADVLVERVAGLRSLMVRVGAGVAGKRPREELDAHFHVLGQFPVQRGWPGEGDEHAARAVDDSCPVPAHRLIDGIDEADRVGAVLEVDAHLVSDVELGAATTEVV